MIKRNIKKFTGYCVIERFCYKCKIVVDIVSKTLEIIVSYRARGALIKVRGELPLESLNLLKKPKTLKIPLEKLKSINKYQVSKKEVNVFKCLEEEDASRNLAVIEITYEGGEVKLLISANEALRLSKLLTKIVE